ncbi:MAG: hypothetical protein ACLTW9_12375 [Enterocloster sp.]
MCSRIEQLVQEEGTALPGCGRDYRGPGFLWTGASPISLMRRESRISWMIRRAFWKIPLVELIRAALETVKDFSYESVFRYLKTGLVYVSREGRGGGAGGRGYAGSRRYAARSGDAGEEDAGSGVRRFQGTCPEQMTDRLENYVRALGIRGWKRVNPSGSSPAGAVKS